MKTKEIDGINRFLFGVMRNIEGIVAWVDWENQPLAFKKNFRSKAARKLNPEVFQHLDNSLYNAREKKKRITSKIRTLFTVKHDKLMVRRGLMHRMYCEVLLPFFFYHIGLIAATVRPLRPL